MSLVENIQDWKLLENSETAFVLPIVSGDL